VTQSQAQRLSAALRQGTWIPDDEVEEKVRKVLHKASFTDDAISFSPERTPQALWTRVSVLQMHIADWATRHDAFSGFYFRNRGIIQDLSKQYEDLEAFALRVFPMLRKTSRESQELEQTTGALAEGFMNAAEQLEEKLCDILSRGVLTCGRTASARSSEFEKIGFAVNVSPGPLADYILLLCVVLTLSYGSLLTYLGDPTARSREL
jgi:hypothetical protein